VIREKDEAALPEDRNVHLSYTGPLEVHHRVVAGLANKYTPEGSVLDIGCGLGYTLYELWRLNSQLELYGADMDEVCLRRTGEKVPGLKPIWMRQGCFDIESLGTGYDTCIVSHVLEHLPCPLEAVHRLFTVVNEGGHLILAVPNLVTPAIILDSIRRKSRVNPGHLQGWDRSHWMNFLQNWVGAAVVEFASDEVRIFPRRLRQRIPFLGFLERIHVGLSKALPWWSFSNIAVIRRPEGDERR